MYRKMLVPLDGSKLSEVVFEYAKELAHRLDLDLILLNVCGPGEYELVPLHRAYLNQAIENISHDLHDIYEWKSIQTISKEVKARAELVYGEPSEEILRYSEEHEIDLILMAAHGRSGGIGTCTLGRVVHSVINKSNVPVWLVPARITMEIIYDEWPTRKMLVPLDGSESAESVLPHVETLSKQRGAPLVDVVLLRICEPPSAITDNIDAVMSVGRKKKTWPDMADHRQAAEQYLAGIENKLGDAGIHVRSEVTMGEPANEIICCANRNPFNLIVMATHGYSVTMPWAHSGVTQKVLGGVSSPVFLVNRECCLQGNTNMTLAAGRGSGNVR